MGGPKYYLKLAGYTDNKYDSERNANKKVTINGVTGVVIYGIDDTDKNHTSLPAYANTSDMYFRYGNDGKTVVQGALYIGQKKICDFDWGHEHMNTDGTKFKEGIVHVQFYGPGPNSTRIRINNGDARYMNNAEIEKFGPIIKHFNPKVKFRP